MANWQPSDRKIHKVPMLLRTVEHNRDDYDPKVVSFGPYHHGKPELQLCESAKSLTLEMFVDGSGLDREFFKRKVFEIIGYAKSCYVDQGTKASTYSDEQFADMMLLDACFLIYSMNIVDHRNSWHSIHIHNYLGRLALGMVIRDMFLLENQIPFQILMLLINLRYGSNGEEKVSKFLHQRIWGHYKQQQSQDVQHQQIRDMQKEHPPLHVFEAYRGVLVWDLTPTNGHENFDAQAYNDLKKFHKTFRSAMDLKAKGIYCKPSEKKSLKIINFSSFTFKGQLELPFWFVSSLSKVFFLNMIAYELCPYNNVDPTVISYLTFMKSLIEKPIDVKELREKKILLTTLGSDEDVVRLYRDLDTFGTDNVDSFVEVKKLIQEHYDSRAKTWKAEFFHVYLSSPWSIIAWVVGLLLFIMTFLQTYFTISK